MIENLSIWNAVSKTDPSHTKKVNQRGGFTAISAHYQIMKATEQFGPLGTGWGYTASDPLLLDGVVTVGVTLWHGDRQNTYGPVWGGADLKDSKGKLDSDAPKKAGTDGLTKALSQLGFNADVFLGRFDDNKYVAQLEREFSEGASTDRIGEDQRATLLTLANQAGADMNGFCTYFRIGALPELPAASYADAKAMLEKKLAQKQAAPAQKMAA
jgi:hypothetical protein